MNADTDSIDFVVKILRTAAYTPSTLTITSELKNFGYRVAENPSGED
jgi:hypothetical protein